MFQRIAISIHALLAESDSSPRATMYTWKNFYPRSPCGERRVSEWTATWNLHFYPRSPCGERHPTFFYIAQHTYFYPRSPCGERHSSVNTADQEARFLSTLSLRRATSKRFPPMCTIRHFYPRSPCGERPLVFCVGFSSGAISIHALLAESDQFC